MKKIFTHLFALFLLSFVTTSNVWAETIELDPSAGTFSGGNSSYCNTWTSNSEPVVTFSVAVNNMTVGAVGGGFGIARGQNADSNWTFSVAGYKILSYSFNYKLQDNSAATDIVITVNNEAHAVTTTSQLLEVNDVNASAASFTLSGTNETIILTDVTIEAEPILKNGAVYRFVCSGTTTVSLGASALTDVAAVSTSETEKAQQWYVTVSDNNYTFRNLANGRYLLGNNGTSGGWALTEASNDFTVTTVNGNYVIRGASHTNGYGYMHKDGSNNIVSWESGAANSQWTPIEVSYTTEELQAVWDEVEALVVPSSTVTGYQEKLNAIFSDNACTKLNDTYAGKTLADIQADANYTGLPAVLQAMVVKVYNEQVSGSTTAWAESTVAPADRPNGNNNTNHNLWTVADTWNNDYAKKFRVQMYEPYSVEGEITSYLRINAHCNMDNPTGIYANAGEPMYIMVEGTIAEGAELWVAHQVGHGATNYYNNAAYTELKEGLNIVPYFADGSQLWINYVVHTYDADGATIETKFPHKLSDYDPLKIHIEGGKINGFFNAMGDYRATTDAENLWGEVDNDADWNYYKARAALSGDFALLGHRQTLLFDFGTYNSTKGHFGVANADGGIEYALAYHLENITVPTKPNCYAGSGKAFGDYSDTYYPGMNLVTEDGTPNKVNIMLEAWDRIQYSEHASLGLLSVANIEKMNALYPRWTTAGEAAEIYNYGEATINNVTQTYQEFCQGIDYSEYFNHHGAAVGAGSGYMSGGWRVCNYHYNTMGSIIGKIAAEAGPTWGPAHEIGHQHQTIFNLNGQTEVTNNFHSNVAVWYMGMGTSRYNGSEGSLASVLGAFNTDGNDLYTNNIWAITHLYYRLWLYYHLAGNNTQFWPRLFELLRQVPIVNGGQISGETSLLRFYRHACDAAGEDLTEFFRAHGFFELMTDRLVGDYSNGTYNVTEEQIKTAISAVKAKGYPNNYAIILINDGTEETTVKHDGKTPRALWDGSASAEYGSVTDFIEGNTSVTAYEATVSADGTVTMSGGTGGVGFLILNEQGEIVSFSNKASFQISDEAAYLLATGKATVVAVDAKSKTTESEVDLSAIQREMLKALIEKVEAMPIDDGSYTHVGFYTKASATELLAALASAKTVYESGSGYGAAYEMLYAEKEKFVNSSNHSFVPFDPSLTYVITNCAYSGKTMHLNSGLKSATGVDQTANTARWQFKTTDTEGVYKLYNTAGYYLTAPAKSATVGSTATVDDAATFTLLQESPVGAWSISLSPAAEYTTLHDNSFGNVVGWSAGVDPSKWYLTAVENNNLDESLVAADELQALIAKTETLVDLVSEISYTVNETPVALQVTNASNDFYVRTNATNTGGDNEGPIANLVDGSTGNFFHTQWGNNAISDDDLDHYIEVSMGNGALSAFSFSYTTRAGVADDYPQIIKIYGSNTENKTGDESEYVLLATVSSGLPASSTQTTYTYPTAIDAGIAYKYLRFMVPTTNKNRVSGGSQHNYWHMAEFDISAATAVATPRTDYSTIDAATILAAYNALNAAKSWVNYEKLTSEQLSAAKSNLETAYKNLKDAYDAVLDAKRTELQTLIESTTILINGTATVTPGTEEKVTLTTTAGSAGYLYCNAQIFEGSLGNLLVDDNTFMHTHWDPTTSADHDYHYLRVDMGEGNTIGEFSFTYTTASRSKKDMPAEIVVEGANEIDSDNSTLDTFTLIETLTSLPEVLYTYSSYTSRILGDANTPYRYLRFKVTKNNCGELDGDDHPFFTMTRFGLTKITSATATVKDTYLNTEATPELVLATYNENSNAAAMKNIATSMAMLQTQIDKLQAAYNALETARETSATPDKTALEELIAATTILKNRMYEIESYTANEITLQNDTEGAAGYLYCNAPETNSGWNTDNVGVKGAIDLTSEDEPDLSTFLHTEYGSEQSADGLDHYLRVDLGTDGATDYIEFGYFGRSGHEGKSPKKVIVAATNDLTDGGEWTTIATLNPAQASASTETKTGCLGNGVKYRYWRFLVEETHSGGKDGNNHQYFCMTEFNVYVCTDVVISSQLKYSPTIYIYNTDELVTEVENAITAANSVVDNEGASQTDVNSEVEALQAVYDKLEEALKYAGIPVVITTDEENPVLYRIISKRADDDSYVLQFDEPTTNKVKIVNPVDNSSYQAWYFMQGEYGYLIKPFNGCGKVLSVESTGDGSAKANIAEESENIYSEWNFSRSAVEGCTDYFYIYVNGTSHACFSHNGNFITTDKMGIWAGGWNTNDGGSLFKFVEAEFDNDNARYYQLSDFENTLEYQTADTPEGTTVGAFVNGTAYGTAYSTASTLIEAGNTSATADCYAAYTALREESKTIKKIIPEAGKYYRIDITPGLTDSRAGASMRVDENGKLACGEYAAANASYIFTFEYDADDNLYMKNLHTATYVDEAPAHNTKTQVGADAESITDAESNAVVAKSISINTLGKSGEAVVVGITPNGGAMLNCAAKVGNVVAFDNTAVDKASAWVITEVALEDIVENIEYSATLGADQTATEPVAYSTLYLSYNATIPDDVTASIVEEIDGDGQLVLVPVTGGILPANTAVVLSQENEGNVVFEYTDEESEFDTEGNILKGTSFTRYVECGDESNIYVLSRKNGHMAFYWAYENRDANGDYVYINANEEIVEKTAEGAHKNHNKGGWVKCNANKSYLQVDEGNGVAAAAMFSFLVGGNTTDIESINAVADEYGNVYDLQGRKLTEITSPGLYIVNGKKVYVK